MKKEKEVRRIGTVRLACESRTNDPEEREGHGRDEMPDEGGDRIDGEERIGSARLAREEQGAETNRHRRRERRALKQHTYRSETGVHIA